MSDYHEPWDAIPEEAREIHRALKSLQEELEAADWYHQRVVTCRNAALRDILAHHRDEEIEHACMLLEWLRREMPEWDTQLRTYLFTEAPIVHEEAAAEHESAEAVPAGGGLRIGSLRGK